MKNYNNLDEINRDLKVLALKRNIALEELKYVRNNTIENFNPYEWIKIYLLKKVTKFGLDFLLKK